MSSRVEIRPRFRFCMPCFRTALANHDEGDENRPDIGCVFDRAASARCKQCQDRRNVCSGVASAMLGNQRDLALMLYWADEQFLDKVDEDPASSTYQDPWFSVETRVGVADACRDLCATFKQVEEDHRVFHRITGAKKEAQAALVAYATFADNRATLAETAAGRLRANASDAQRSEWNSARLPRLRVTDAGAAAWDMAILAFREVVETIIVQEPGVPVSHHDEALSLFPVPLPEV